MEDRIKIHINARLLILSQDIKDAQEAMKKENFNGAIGALAENDSHILEILGLLRALRKFKA